MVYILIAPYSQDLIKVYEIKFSSDNISHFMENNKKRRELNFLYQYLYMYELIHISYAAYYIDILIYIWHYLLPALMIAS